MKNIIKFLKLILTPKYFLYLLCQKYIKIYEEFSYVFEKNGEKNIIKKLKKQNFKIIFDVGANRGDWTSVALNFFESAFVHSFELSPNTFKKLSQNIVNKRAILNNFALSNTEGKIKYNDYGEEYDTINTILHNTAIWDKTKSHEIKDALVTRGDNYCKTNNIKSIDFLKIDVEGSEHMVLEGFTDLLSKKAIKVIQFEYGYANADVHFLMRDFFKFFERFGYIIGKLTKNGVIFSDFDYKLNDFNSGPNFVAIRNDDIQLKEFISCKPILGVGILVKSN
tara:strand:- start:57 stop:896 length:840 start_codon:yes stop_codon:yes gene_type:complete